MPSREMWIKGGIVALVVLFVVANVGPVRRIILPDAARIGG